MAADILLYQADFVPVGDDQKQHVELCPGRGHPFQQHLRRRFHRAPGLHPASVGARIMSLTDPTSKMSKSDKDPNGCVHLMEKPGGHHAQVQEGRHRLATPPKTASASTPLRKPGVANLMQIYSCATGKTFDEIEKDFARQGLRRLQDRRGRGRCGTAAAHP